MLQKKILQTIRNYNLIQKSDKIVIGVSGGADSMCLLDILYCLKNELGIEIFVSHINHGIRQEANEDAIYVENYCEKKEIPCYIKKVDIISLAKEKKIGTEVAGRQVRYDFFEEVAKKVGANKVATAHTANDNAETVLMNIIRGSGISGLKGIEIARSNCDNYIQMENSKRDASVNDINSLQTEVVDRKKVTYIRPLRKCNRIEIEEYCEEKKLNPKIDKTNLENEYTRNKIRNILIPHLQKEFNPNIVQTLNRLSDIAKEDENYFAEIVQTEYENLKIGENVGEIILDLKKFNQLPKVIKIRVLLYTINKVTGSTQGISKIHLEDIIKLCQNNIGNKYLTPHKNIKIFVKKGKIFLQLKLTFRKK